MWNRITHALKRPSTPAPGGPDDSDGQGTDVMASVYEQHPNLSVFHHAPSTTESTDVPFPTPSPPPSPSATRNGRLSLRKRLSRNIFNDSDAGASSSSIRLPISIPKKVKSSLQSINTGSDVSVNRSPVDSRQSQDTGRPSVESARSPMTPINETKFGSLRSILKPNNTPGTGQSVRFFSRDAYKFISPEASSSSSLEDPSLFTRMQKVSPPRRSVQGLFSSTEPTTPVSPIGASSLMPIPPPDLSNIFDLSDEKELSVISPNGEELLLDSAIEISESEDHDGSLIIHDTPQKAAPPPREPVLQPSPTIRTSLHDRSQSFSFGQTVFHSMPAETSPMADGNKGVPNKFGSVPRNRALSDTVFHTMLHTPNPASQVFTRPEADINDVSTAVVAYGSPEREKDPFGANAMTYYTPGTMLPSPPQGRHTRTASKEEDIIWSLRTQLALQSELCAQYEVDLSARDELVQTLNTRLAESEKECERRKSVVRTWRKKVSELEKCVRGLEEEVERSREESLERSVMDEASGEALRMLHRRIGDLEREKGEVEKREVDLTEELGQKNTELERLKKELQKRNESERELQDGIRAAQEEMQLMGVQRQSVFQSDEQQEELRALLARNTHTVEQQEGRHREAASAWEEERTQLRSDNDELRKEQGVLQSQITDAREEVLKKEEDAAVLRAELEAQWKHTEKMNEQIEQLTSERDALKAEIDELHDRISAMELDYNENENKKNQLDSEIQELWATKEDLEHERDELEEHLQAEQEHSEGLTQALQEQESRITLITQERQYANDSVARLQEHMRQRDEEIAEQKKRVMECENEVGDIRAEMTRAKRDHSRTVDEQSRTLSDVIAREVEARANMENMIKEKVENEVLLRTTRKNIKTLNEEIEKLRRQVHDLQHESADKDIKLAQAAKQRNQDKEDMQGLNIALDSKQQELELLKRRVVTKTTATTTPSATAKAPFRRESSIFGTPSASRPPSVMSDASASTTDRRKSSDPTSAAAKAALVRSARMNATSHPPSSTSKRMIDGSMGPPPTKRSSLFSSTSSATPTRTPPFTRATSVTPTATAASRRASASIEPAHVKKASISSRDSLKSTPPSERGEKENRVSPPTARPVRRLSKVPA